ncbi:Hypothetical predicted protein [Pelobates cultripes]|uniref:Uncharacterized protein n=1 Tax=Pelobates cultripes TaxID=61616 RepID=A0AAD1R422_PELCU|nr:Hypothetical predicted protein [Pelobates cultripes]
MVPSGLAVDDALFSMGGMEAGAVKVLQNRIPLARKPHSTPSKGFSQHYVSKLLPIQPSRGHVHGILHSILANVLQSPDILDNFLAIERPQSALVSIHKTMALFITRGSTFTN